MDYDKIIIDLLNRIVTLEERVAKLENGNTNAAPENTEFPAGSKKYRFLSDYLYESNQPRVKLSYAEIEEILRFKLPDSAATHRAFWANTKSHSIALSWLSVNYSVVEVNLEERYIVFEKKRNFDKMTIDEQMRTIVAEMVAEFGPHHEISLRELYEMLGARFQTNSGSIIPSDYCYNRANKGIDFEKKPRLLEYLGDGMYKCLGEHYPYDKPVYTREKGAAEDVVVGRWENGNLIKNDNWNYYGLK
jgi:hypothetical protein